MVIENKSATPFSINTAAAAPSGVSYPLLGDFRTAFHNALRSSGAKKSDLVTMLSLNERRMIERERLEKLTTLNHEQPENFGNNCIFYFGSMLSYYQANEQFMKKAVELNTAGVLRQQVAKDAATVDEVIGGKKHAISGAEFLDTKKLLDQHNVTDLYMYLSGSLNIVPGEINDSAEFCQNIIASYAQTDILPPDPPGINVRDIHELLRKIKTSTVAVSERFREVLFDPSHPDHASLTQIVENQLATPGAELVPLPFIGDLKQGYRDMVRYVDKNGKEDVFVGLMSIEEWYLSHTRGEYLTFQEELEEYQRHELPAGESIDYDNIAVLTRQIFNYSSHDSYLVGIHQEDWDTFEEPDSLGISFGKGNPPKEVFMGITYGKISETSTPRTMSVRIDLKGKDTEWSLIDIPDKNPDLLSHMAKAAIISLTHLRDDLKEEWEEKRRQRNAVLVGSGSKKAVQRSVHPSIHESDTGKMLLTDDDTRALFLSRMVPNTGAETETMPEEKREVKSTIILPEGEALEILLKGFSAEDRRLMLDDINAFNKYGRGRFYTLKKPRKDERMYALRVAATAPSGARVLLTEHETKPGERSLEIVKIGYRATVYKDVLFGKL